MARCQFVVHLDLPWAYIMLVAPVLVIECGGRESRHLPKRPHHIAASRLAASPEEISLLSNTRRDIRGPMLPAKESVQA